MTPPMNADLKVGTNQTISVTITDDMRPAFAGRVVHDVCSTWDLARHLETAARAVLEPYLQEDEEGIGSHLSIDHIAPAPVGSTITIRAEAIEVSDTTLVCSVTARDGDTELAHARQVQRVLPRTAIDEIMHRALHRAQSSPGASDP
ncbi:MAG: hypothetical protein MK101_08910 [Phycisphaerales bacterium]|nr:hypothetical protein [Phycisphaerales bacterium]